MSTLLDRKSQLDGPREAWLSIDDSVSVLYGNQENNSTGQYSLHPGSVHSNDQFADFLEETINNLPRNTVPKEILVDKGFFSEDNCNLF